MSVVRRLLVLSAAVSAVMASIAATSAATIVVSEEGGARCPGVPIVDAHAVTGGCHVSFASSDSVSLFAHIGPAEVIVSSCLMSYELRLSAGGTGYITEQAFSEPPAPGTTCTRAPCDEAGGGMTKLPWPFIIEEDAFRRPTAELTFCMRPATAAEGTSAFNCTLHPSMAGSGHTYVVSTAGEAACEGAAQVEVSGTFVSADVGTELIEVRTQ